MPREYRQEVFKPPKDATEILLIRHGESQPAYENQAFPMKDGHGDPELHANGYVQAQAVASRLKSRPIDAIYVTTLQRTHQTAAPLAKALNQVPRVESDLREVCFGEWDGGLYRIKAADQDPIFLESMKMHEWGIIPGAETTEQVKTRVNNGLRRIAVAHPNQLVVAVVHSGVIAAILSIATGADAFSFFGAANGSISRIVIDKNRIIVRGFNDTSHLD